MWRQTSSELWLSSRKSWKHHVCCGFTVEKSYQLWRLESRLKYIHDVNRQIQDGNHNFHESYNQSMDTINSTKFAFSESETGPVRKRAGRVLF